MVEDGTALCVNGNHDDKFRRYLEGRNVKTTHGLDLTIAQMEDESEIFRGKVKDFLTGLISHYWLDGGALAIAHAGLNEDMFGRASGQIRAFAMYGDTTGETDEFGLPVRYNWAADYRGKTAIVYGHTPIPEAEWLNGTLCVDTGCVFGGKLTALRWPERELVSVPAKEVYAEPARPLGYQAGGERSNQAIVDDMLDLDDVRGKRIIETRLFRTVTIGEAHSAAALEAMSRFAMNPKWLVYLPPTMSPSETSDADNFLEHPAEAFAFFHNNGVEKVVCEEKHMGSRAVIIVCRDNETAQRRFGIAEDDLTGAIHTRTGRAFFSDASLCEMLLARLRSAMDACDFWDRFETDWAVLDTELMPWSAKAKSLLLEQYAPVGAAATLSAQATHAMFEAVSARGVDIGDALAMAGLKERQAADYVRAWQHYCWDVKTLDDYRIAPFHLLATEGTVHMDKTHVWHMEELAKFAESDDPVIMATPFRTVELADDKAVTGATEWWLDLTGKGGEGMVIKPLDFITRGKRGLVQPALKCRGRDYLRIIYGPEYDSEANLARLRKRGLAAKRGLASREFALGFEALSRFVEHEPLRRVHECAFGVLALESEPVDPRL
jgi:protein phosphatase